MSTKRDRPAANAEKSQLHASAVVIAEAGVLICGPSGAGKSSLAFALITAAEDAGLFARLVGDDRIGIESRGGRLIAHGHPMILGKIERRGQGIFEITVFARGRCPACDRVCRRGRSTPAVSEARPRSHRDCGRHIAVFPRAARCRGCRACPRGIGRSALAANRFVGLANAVPPSSTRQAFGFEPPFPGERHVILLANFIAPHKMPRTCS